MAGRGFFVDVIAEAIDLTKSPISVHSSMQDDDEDEDDLEEVEIPPTASASMPGTPASGVGSAANYGGGSDVNGGGGAGGYNSTDDEEDAQVIRLEIGGETEEEKAKRIALAMRK